MRLLFLPALFVALFSFSCGSDSTDDEKDSLGDPVMAHKVSIDTALMPSEISFTKDTFFRDSFLVLIDSFFTAYAGGEIDIHYTMDSLTTRDTSARSRKYIIKPVNGSFARWYIVDAGETNNSMVFQLAECCYPDSSSTEKGWSEFVRLGANDARLGKAADDNFPCLSYGNDLAFRTGNKIFWLCTYCNWDYDKHQIIASLVKRCIYDYNVKEEIKCRCGDAWPRTN